MPSITAQQLGAVREARREPQASLASLHAGEDATVARLALAGGTQERLMEMGLVPGTPITMMRAGRRHLVIALRGYVLGLGRPEAAHIEVVARPQVR